MAKAARRKIPELTSREFAEKYAGTRVAVAFNLHKARGTEPTPGEFIFTVREKAGGKVLAHVDEIALEHVTPKILPGSLRRIKERGVREVCCYLMGTVVRPKDVPPRGRKSLRFNPFKADCFTVDDGRCLEAAQFVLFTGGRRTLGVKVELEGATPTAKSTPKAKATPKAKPKRKAAAKGRRSSRKLTEAEKAANTRRLVSQIASGQARLF